MEVESKTADDMAKSLKRSFDTAMDEVKGIATDALGKANVGEKLTAKMKEDADEALTKINVISEQVKELGQKMVRPSEPQGEDRSTLGSRFVSDSGVKSWLDSEPKSGVTELRVKATITTSTANAAGSVGQATDVHRVPGIIAPPQRRMTVRDLFSQGKMESASIEWVREIGFNNNAATVAEGELKPESDIQLTTHISSASVIAHFMKVSRQALDDVDQLGSHIDSRLFNGLDLKEENQLLNGDGVGSNILGISSQATALAPAFAPALETAIDRMRLAALQVYLAEYPATGYILNPIDWGEIELLKDTEGRYIIGNPQGTLAASLWGLPVVTTQAMPVGTFLTGAFSQHAQIWDRWRARIEVGYVNDDFTRNLVTILAEEQIALTVYRPEGFVHGSLAPV